MEVDTLTTDPERHSPVVVLREIGGNRTLPIWVGVVEASWMAFELEETRLPRPLTLDLLCTTITALNATVKEITLVDLQDNIYLCTITLRQGNETIVIDARPSDAIALAMRFKTPILCLAQVIARAELLCAQASRQKIKREKPSKELLQEDELSDEENENLLTILEDLELSRNTKYKT